MNWAVQLVIAFVIFASGAALGVKVHSGLIAQRDLAEQQQQAKETGIKLARGDKAAVGLEKDKAQIRTEFLTITKEVERVVQKPIYLATCFDDDGLRLINAAIAPATPASQPAPAVPGPRPTD